MKTVVRNWLLEGIKSYNLKINLFDYRQFKSNTGFTNSKIWSILNGPLLNPFYMRKRCNGKKIGLFDQVSAREGP